MSNHIVEYAYPQNIINREEISETDQMRHTFHFFIKTETETPLRAKKTYTLESHGTGFTKTLTLNVTAFQKYAIVLQIDATVPLQLSVVRMIPDIKGEKTEA
ncbi:hypothetical protein BaRGS_00039028, partial [Batillaria attramentaria]